VVLSKLLQERNLPSLAEVSRLDSAMLGELVDCGSCMMALTTPCCVSCVRNTELGGKTVHFQVQLLVAARPFHWIKLWSTSISMRCKLKT